MANANMGGGTGGGTSTGKGGKNTKWAFFRNQGISGYNGPNGKVSVAYYNKLEPAARARFTAITGQAKGGDWVKVGSKRWDSLKSQDRAPTRMINAPSNRGKPPHPGDRGGKALTNWMQTGNPNKPGRDASKTGAAGDGTKSGEDVTHSPGGIKPRQYKAPGSQDNPPGYKSGLMKKLMGMMGNANVGHAIPRSLADQLAGLQYDAQIHDLNVQAQRQPVQAAQDLADVSGFYGRAQDLNQQAGDRNHALAGNLADQMSGVTQSLMAAGGGSANDANGMLAAQGANANALMAMLGQNESQYRNDMSPLLQQASADAKTNMINTQTQAHQDLATQIADLMGQRGQAKSKAIMDIIQANNSLAQSRFGNRLSQMQAAAGIQSLIPDLKLKNAQLQGTQLDNGAKMQELNAGAGGGHMDLSSMNPYQQSQIMSSVMMNPDGTQAPKGKAMARLRASGYHTHYATRLLNTYY